MGKNFIISDQGLGLRLMKYTSNQPESNYMTDKTISVINNTSSYQTSGSLTDKTMAGYNKPSNYQTSGSLADKTMTFYNKPSTYETSGSLADKTMAVYNKPSNYETSDKTMATIPKNTASFYVTDTPSSVYQAKILFAIVIGLVMVIEIV
jgi:lysozyme family protein